MRFKECFVSLCSPIAKYYVIQMNDGAIYKIVV